MGRHVVQLNLGDVPAILHTLRATLGICETDQLIAELWVANQRIGYPVGDPIAPADNGEFHLRCRACGATWVGNPYEVCGWCVEGQRLLAIDQERKAR